MPDSSLIPRDLITPSIRLTSSFRMRSSSSGLDPTATAPMSFRRAFTPSSASALTMASWAFCTTALSA
jgi:hypothetical protein